MDFINFIKTLIFGRQISQKTKKLVLSVNSKYTQIYNNSDSAIKKSYIVELDSALSACLNDLYGKDSVANNLKKAKLKFNKTTYQNLWEGHKIRNKIIHEPTLFIDTKTLNYGILSLIKGIKSF